MGDKNKICDAIEDIKAAKQNILNKIKKLQSLCAGAPSLIIDTSLPSLNINFAVLYLLQDILALLSGLNIDEIKALIINWLNNNLKPLQKRIQELLKQYIKDCFTCKISATIPPWLFYNNPLDGSVGNGLNFQIEQIDLQCLLKINPNTELGDLLYDNGGLNYFLWETIQSAGTPRLWVTNTGKPIAWFTFLEDDPTAYTESTTPGGVQNVLLSKQNNVFKIQIDNSYYNKSLTTFINDYVDSIAPLFDVTSVIPKSMDILYGTVGSNLNLSEPCAEKIQEFQVGLEKLINNGVDDPDIIMDNTFFEFSTPEVMNIKEQTLNYRKGERPFSSCCNKRVASVDVSNLIDLNKKLKDPNVSESEKAGAIEDSMDAMKGESIRNVDAIDTNKGEVEFIGNIINSLSVAIPMLTFTPKVNVTLMTVGYLSQGVSSFDNSQSFFKFFMCILRNILGELLRKLIFEFLIPFILRNLRPIIQCVILKYIKEKQENLTLSVESLLPTNQLLPDGMKEKISKAMGGAEGVVNKVSQISNNLNVADGLDALKKDKSDKGKFCD